MTLASLARTRVTRAFFAFLVLISALVLVPGSDSAVAAGTPDISMTKSMPGEALAGDPAIPVKLSASNPTGTDGFNLTFVDVLPAGVVFVSGDPAPSQILSNEPNSGETTIVWTNVADLQAGVTESVSYTVTHTAALDVGDSFTNRASAYVSVNPRVVPTYNPAIDGVNNPTTFGRHEDVSATTDLLPFILTKSEPSVEQELLRGLHDHQTFYTLEIENNHLRATNNFAIEDWIPAGMEFLGCGTADNSTTGEEYTSSGVINPGNAPTMSNPCVVPDIVETVDVDPPGPLGQGIYTHVVWNVATLATSLPTSGIARFDYIAAIPMNANTLNWPGGIIPATNGPQGSNIDNNTGASTNETGTEQQMTNGARATGTYTGDGVTYTDLDEMTVSAEDLSIHKGVDNDAITHGADSGWTLFVETSEYTGTASGLVVTDTVPDGLCPNGASSPLCPGGTGPSLAYTSAIENADGTWTLVWNLPDMTRSDDATITFSTTTLSNYREGFANAAPVVANDSWTNSVLIRGDVDGRAVEDVSSDDQEAAPVTIVKEVSDRQDPLVSCAAVPATDWNASLASGYHIGDQVCWRLGVDFPVDLDTFDSDIQDYLPPGHTYTADDSWTFGANNTVAAGDVVGPDAGDIGETVLAWTVGDGSGYVAEDLYLEVVFSSTIADPNATESGSIVENLMKYSYENSAGTPFNLRDLADIEVIEAELDLVKGVIDVSGTPTGGNNVDGVQVMEADDVTYQLTITNDGDLDANDLEVWDLLPPEYSPCAANVTVNDGGSCATATRIEWTGLTVPANGSIAVTYVVALPTGIAPNETIPNTAGVRSYSSDTNNGTGTFTYYPADNIDPTAPAANTTAADDPSSVVTANVRIDKASTTEIDESGNALADQATIGEIVYYTVTVDVPEGTTINTASVSDALPINLQYLSSSHSFTGVGGDAAITVAEAGGTVTATFPDPYTNPPGSAVDTLTLNIEARVLDVPQNFHNLTIANTATFAWENQDGTPRTADASVNTTVVEPLMGIDKTSVDSDGNDGIVVGGETVDYTLAISNGNGASMAHDLVVVDTVPVGLTPTLASISDLGAWDEPTRTITWTIASLDSNSTVNRTYSVTVDDPVVVSTDLTNNVVVDATSMAEPSTGERSSGTRYQATDSDTQSSPLASIAKSVTPLTATIGDVLTYTIDVTIPPGSIMYDATVIDTLPPGLSYDGMVGVSSCDMNGSACDPDITATDIGVVGSQAVGFWLDDIDTASATGETRIVTITYEAHVLNTLSRGNTPQNAASVYGNQTDKILVDPTTPPPVGGFDVNAGPAVATVTIVEPQLTVDKDVSGQIGDSDWRRALPGEILTYTVTVTNSGAANMSDAHDLTIVDTLTDLPYITVSAISDAGQWDAPTDTITWEVAGPLAPGDSVSFTYDVTLDTPLGVDVENAAGAELVNTADVPSYFGVPLADREANPSFTFVEYDDVTPDVVSVELDLASIGDYIWFDVNGDGVQDADEPPLAGVDVTVTYLGLDGVAGGGDDEVHLVTTDANGLYLVDELPGGNYTVVVDDTDIPAGMAPSYNLDATVDHTWPGTLGEDEDKEDVDFGYTGTGSIGDTVWFDINPNGVVDGNEFGLEGVDVDVTWFGFDGVAGGGDDIVYPATTDAAGNYLVANLPAGNYSVEVDTATLPPGMGATFDSDGIDTAGVSLLTLGAAASNLDQDFGYAGTGSIGDFIWLDSNEDGVQDTGEPGLVGVPVQLTWPGEDGVLGGGDDEVFLTTTDGSGGYLFDNLPPGDYQVDVLGGLPAAATNTYDEDDGTVSPDSSTVVNLGDGVDHETADFGYNGTASIGDTVWWDMNGDGVLDTGEPGIEGVEIVLVYAGLDGVFGNADDLTFTDTTDANGNYMFTDLPTGDYSVTVNSGVPAGFTQTYDETGGLDETSLVTGLTTGEIHLTADFGYNGTGSIGDLVFLDSSNDGVDDPGEPGIPGVEVQLTWYGVDGTEGTADDVVLTTTTDPLGFYLFPDLPAGGYDVAVITAALPPGLTPTGDADGVDTPNVSSLVLGDGADDLDQDFGYAGGGSIGDTIWFDRNSDGVVDADEYGLGGVDVDVTWAGPDGVLGNGDDEIFTTTTDVDGNYLVSNLPPGVYMVSVDPATLPAGMAPTFDEDGTLDNETSFVLADLENHLTADFGYTGSGDIGDLVWLDLNGDGIADAGEPGIPAQTVELTWAGPDGTLGNADDQVYTTTTDANGNYLFDQLPPGDYEVEVTGPIVGAATNTEDEDGDDDSHTPVTLGDGASHDTADFGYIGSAEIGDLIWLDLDGDGTADLAEPGLVGVEVTVVWYGDDGVPGGGDDVALPSYTTDAAGNYLATGLPDGSYGVAVISGVPTGLVNSADEDNDLDDQTDVAGLTAGASHLTADFGYTGEGSIGDTIWWDLDGDTVQGTDEPGLSGIDVSLTWAGLDGVFGSADDAVFTTTTDADGMYLFEHLPPGDYQVAVDETDLPLGVTQSADPDATIDGMSALTLGVGEANLDQDFGYRGDGSVGDFIWYDINNDGIQDPDEPGVAGVQVTVTYLGSDGVPGGGDDVDFVAVTDADGSYTVPGLPSGFYVAVVDPATVPTGLTVSSDLDGGDPMSTAFTLGAAENKTDIDYPVIGDASLSGTVWNDGDGDQVIDGTEPGIPGVTVIVTWDGPDGPVVITVVSGPDGTWDLPTLPAGDYTVELDLTTVPDDMTPTTDTDAAVTLPVGGHENVDFGLAEVVNLGSTVWIDTDGDGVVDPDEAGIPNVTVNLYDETGLLIAVTVTDDNGNYLFTDLPPGTYLVSLDPDSLPDSIRATFDRDGSPDLNTLVHLGVGVDILDANFGFQTTLPVTGFEVGSFAMIGAIFLLLGLVLVGSARIRKTRVPIA